MTDNIARPRHLRRAIAWRRTIIATLTALVASVWLYHGLGNKLLEGSPRHLRIIQSIPWFAGDAGPVMLTLVGAGEIVLAAWVVSGWRPRTCAALQSVALLSMNVLELTFARPHLLWPAMLVPVNVLFLAAAWTAAELRRGHAEPREGLRVRIPMLHRLRRHPLVIDAHFDHCLVLTYALPPQTLAPLLPPGLTLDTHDGHAFLAVAMVQTRRLRPAFLPKTFGQDFVLAGYRVFTKFHTPDGRTIRGLRILRSDTDSRRMVVGGNLLTHYNYHRCSGGILAARGQLAVDLRTPAGSADLSVLADLQHPGELPNDSPFTSLHDALRFAGPLPYTFDYERQTHSIIAIKGVREHWSPRLVNVTVRHNTLLDRPPFVGASPVLASAFYVSDIDYRWLRGVRHPLAKVKS